MDNNHIIWGNVKEWNNFILVLAKFRCWFWICLLLISLWCFRKCVDTSNSHAEKWVVTTEEFSYFMALILKAANRPLRTSLCTNHLTSPPLHCQMPDKVEFHWKCRSCLTARLWNSTADSEPTKHLWKSRNW